MKSNKSLKLSLIVIAMLSGCSIDTTNVINQKKVISQNEDFTFSTKDLTQSYVEKKLRKLNVDNNGLALVRFLDFARVKGTSAGNIPVLMRTVFQSDLTLKSSVKSKTEIVSKRSVDRIFDAFAIYVFGEASSNPIIYNTVTTVAGTGSSGFVDAIGSDADFSGPMDLAVDGTGNIFVVDRVSLRIRKIANDANHTVTTVAGSGDYGFADGVGSDAKFETTMNGITIDSSGNLFVVDTGNSKIRKIANDVNHTVTTITGTGIYGFADGVGTNAKFSAGIYGITVDNTGNLFVADGTKIRKIANDIDHTVTTIAGSGAYGFADGVGSDAKFNNASGLSIDSLGNLFVADTINHKIRKITNDTDHTVTTIAGNNIRGFANGVGTNSSFNFPIGITIDSIGNLFVTDALNHRIRKIANDTDHTVTTIAGDGTPGIDNGISSNARFTRPRGIAIDSAGNLFIAQTDNNLIRKISP